ACLESLTRFRHLRWVVLLGGARHVRENIKPRLQSAILQMLDKAGTIRNVRQGAALQMEHSMGNKADKEDDGPANDSRDQNACPHRFCLLGRHSGRSPQIEFPSTLT